MALWLVAGPVPAAVLHRGNTGEIANFDPQQAVAHYEATVLRDLYDGLVIRSASGGIAPGAAVGWQIGGGGTVYVFRLDPRAGWSNGRPVTAGDFVGSLRRAVDPANEAPYAALLSPIVNAPEIMAGREPPASLGVEATDDHTLTITLSHPSPWFLDLLTHPVAMPVPDGLGLTLLAGDDADGTVNGEAITNGSYRVAGRVADRQPGEPLVLEANPYHPGAADLALSQVIYYPTADRDAALQAFQTGALDINNDVPLDRIDWLEQVMPEEFHRAPWLAVEFYSINLRQAPWDDPALRRALWSALDLGDLARGVMSGAVFPADRLVPPGIGWYDAAAGAVAGAADRADGVPAGLSRSDRVARAVEVLSAAGYGPENPVTVELRVNNAFHHLEMARAIARQWRPLGVVVHLLVDDPAAHFAYLREGGSFQMARAGWVADTPDPEMILELFRCPPAAPDGEAAAPDGQAGGDGATPVAGPAAGPVPMMNFGGYCNPAVDDLLDRAAGVGDPARRAQLLAQAEAQIMTDMPVLPLYFHASLNLVSAAVTGWQDNVMDVHPSRFLGFRE